MLLDVDGTETSMSGLVMELEDYASPYLKSRPAKRLPHLTP